ncbi:MULTISPECIES: Gp138 family membrane-puncturing spike protein [unclassified Serratia (in: enterobacteria)]|uniref:Gp138 family membrane-puncturing spike protein n=1 Tax=unclassified Serratia (in: enterobacteria) TaxID=2647522 RepID=UPI0005008EC8|nr:MULTISPECIES: Gp138 family membrane-puncturing spike protein [unclassified Serratia (in: enterobacteria)]KFK92586.1 hypothetical protein JV45_20380 [Serratia sp. Ag2]KFK97114.1 hypothetical protein IV04_17575 [Serratia sp. Ag1]
MITNKERASSTENILDTLRKSLHSELRVAMPGIIESFNPNAVTCEVRPAIRGSIENPDGTVTQTELPLLVDVPVIFPRGGGVSLTFPVKTGDECLVVFADRCIDFWWQSGDVQDAVDGRMHHLADAFAILGPQSQPHKISNISTSAAQLRSDDGAAMIELLPDSHAVNVITSGKLTANANGGTEITSPSIVLNGSVTINGSLSQGMGSGGGAATLNGPVTVKNDVTAGGISLKNHKHSGVQTGSGTTGGAQ